MSTVRELEKETAECLYKTVDGKGLKQSNMEKTQHHWLSRIERGNQLRGHTFVNAVKMRGNLIGTPARKSRGDRGQGGCHRCGYERKANLNHILQMCSVTHGLRVDRHDRLKGLVAGKARARGWNVLIEQPISTQRGGRKPDLIFSGKVPGTERKVIVVADVIITNDCEGSFERAKIEKLRHYGRSDPATDPDRRNDNPEVEAFAREWANDLECEFFVVGLIWNWRGMVEPETAAFLTRMLKLGKSILHLASIRCLEKCWSMWSHWRDSTYVVRYSG